MNNSNDIEALREHLFATLTALRDKENPMPIDRAKAIADVAQVVINTAKVEVDMIEAVGTKILRPSAFIPNAARPAIAAPTPAGVRDVATAGTNVRSL